MWTEVHISVLNLAESNVVGREEEIGAAFATALGLPLSFCPSVLLEALIPF